MQVDDDEAFLLDGLDTTLGGGAGNFGVRCDATACNPVIYPPGPFATFPGVGWLKNLNISLQCGGKVICQPLRRREKERADVVCICRSATHRYRDFRHMIDPEKFKQGLSAVIDGTVLCLNASTWGKPTQP